MRYGQQTFYCNNCGKRLHCDYARLRGRQWKVCSSECQSEMELKYAKCILGESTPECICTPEEGRALHCPAHGLG